MAKNVDPIARIKAVAKGANMALSGSFAQQPLSSAARLAHGRKGKNPMKPPKTSAEKIAAQFDSKHKR